MTALADILKGRIAQAGPMPLSDYMADCLMHPDHGYYATRDPFGAAGDFVTAPEISQMFGELIGLCLAQAWMDQGSPDRVVLAELGPGRGTLMADALRATARVPGFHEAAEVVLVEASPTLRALQSKAVPKARHEASVALLPEAPLYLIANEFLDALPIRQFRRAGAGWSEVVVGLRNDTLTPGLTDPAPVPALDHRLEDTQDGDIVELCPALPSIVSEIGQRIARHGGAALLIDYGDWRSLGDTLQALRAHEPADPFAAPGQADLTAHVDFEAVARAAAPAAFTRLTPQGVFLERLGITARAQALAEKSGTNGPETVIAAHRRLTHPGQMGHLFKAMGLYPPGCQPPPGLEP